MKPTQGPLVLIILPLKILKQKETLYFSKMNPPGDNVADPLGLNVVITTPNISIK
jgi:hypothetical protein